MLPAEKDFSFGLNSGMNPIFLSHCPLARRENLLFQSVGEEMVIYDRQRSTAHHLNATASVVWRHCDGGHSVAQLGELLLESIGQASPGASGQDVSVTVQDAALLALEQLQKAQLLATELPVFLDSHPVTLQTAEKSPNAPPKQLTRRQLLRGAASGLMVLPLVASIVAPTLVQHSIFVRIISRACANEFGD